MQRYLYKVQLTPQEYITLSSTLPCEYSLQVCSRSKPKQAERVKQQARQQQQRKEQPKKGGQVAKAVRPCLKILLLLSKNKNSLAFLQPVDGQSLGIPQYNQIIKDPMDLYTISQKIYSYTSIEEFNADVLKIISNSYLFNENNEDYLKITAEFQRYYYRIMNDHKLPYERLNANKPKPQKKKKKPLSSHSEVLTTEKKKELAHCIQRLAKEHLITLRRILEETDTSVVEFDLETLTSRKLKQINKFLRDVMEENKRNEKHGTMDRSALDQMESEVSEPWIQDKRV